VERPLKFDGSVFELPWDPGLSPSLGEFDPNELTDAQLASIVAVLEARGQLKPKVDKALALRIQELLDPVQLQPAFKDKDGELQPYGDVLAVYLGKPHLLPPQEIEISTDGRISTTQAPLGSPLRLKMGGKITDSLGGPK